MTSQVANKIRIKTTQPTKAGQKLYLDEKHADVHFIFNSDDQCERVPAHKQILIGSSDVFEVMFDDRWKEKKEVEIKDASAAEFKEFMQFVYRVDPDVSIANVPAIMYLLKKYDLEDCLHDCAQTLQQNLKRDEICTGLDLAVTFDQNDLKLHCLEQIGKYTETVFGTDAFLRCSKAALTSILEGDNISCDELKVFNACIEWAKSKCQEGGTNEPTVAQLKHQLADCLHFVQFRLMSPQQISDCVVGQKGLFNQEELEELFSISSKKPSLKIFKNVKRQRSTINTDETMHVREATFVFTVRDFSKLKDPVRSPPCYVRNLPWKIMVKHWTSDSGDQNQNSRSMGFYLQCNAESESTSWSCFAKADLKLLSFKPHKEPFVRQINHLFYSKENDWGFTHFINWYDVLDPERGYIQDDKIVLEVHVVADAPEGVS